MATPLAFFTRRWRHGLGPNRLLLWEALTLGTVLNLLASFAGLMAVAMGGSGTLGLALHTVPVPANTFWALCVWRHPQAHALHRIAALGWWAVMLLV